MYKGDLVRILSLRTRWTYSPSGQDEQLEDDFNKHGVLIEHNTLLGTCKVLVEGQVHSYRSSDVQLMKRSPENSAILKSLGKLKFFPHQIYCDMDGVLVDFEGAATKSINKALLDPPEGLEALCEAVRGFYGDSIDLSAMKVRKEKRPECLRTLIGELFENDKDWWANLPFLEEGRKLWMVLSKIEPKPMLLTSPMDHNGGTASRDGKLIWVQKNLNLLDTIRWDKRTIFSHNKYEYAMDIDKPNVLIDDYPKKVVPFNENGGFGILHKNNCIETLDALKEVFDGNFRRTMGKDS